MINKPLGKYLYHVTNEERKELIEEWRKRIIPESYWGHELISLQRLKVLTATSEEELLRRIR